MFTVFVSFPFGGAEGAVAGNYLFFAASKAEALGQAIEGGFPRAACFGPVAEVL